MSAAVHMEAFSATLHARERRLAGRLEGFGDIVFGFAVSQCALQLTTVAGRVDIARPASVALYFGTFALLASLWLTYHRILSGAFKPAGIDLFLSFAYLAFVSLLPYAMYALSHSVAKAETAKPAVAEYSGLFIVTMLIAGIVTLRNLRRGWYYMDESDRHLVWRDLVVRCSLVATMTAAFVADFTIGPLWSAAISICVAAVVRIARARTKSTPKAAWLHVGAPPASATDVRQTDIRQTDARKSDEPFDITGES